MFSLAFLSHSFGPKKAMLFGGTSCGTQRRIRRQRPDKDNKEHGETERELNSCLIYLTALRQNGTIVIL
jgi:hypothetical protein